MITRPRVAYVLAVALAAAMLVSAAWGGAPRTGDASTPGPGAARSSPATGQVSPRWDPEPGLRWQWQLVGPVDTSHDVDVYDLDLFDTPAATVRRLTEAGRATICYVSVGTWEPWRPDAGDVPDVVIGAPVEAWPDERWLDVRQVERLRPIVQRRLDLCVAKGFDAVEPDNVDGYAHATGFPISPADQTAFLRMVVDESHRRGLAVALKNDPARARALEPMFDLAISEECFRFATCHHYDVFVEADKPVLIATYSGDLDRQCAAGARAGFSVIRKSARLDAPTRWCDG